MSNDMAEAVAAMIAEQAKVREQLYADRQTAAVRKRQEKTAMAERRTWGLRRRHANKLARNANAA